MSLEGDAHIEEITSVSEAAAELIEQGDGALTHIVVDTRDMTSIPTNLAKLLKAGQVMLSQPQIGWSITVGLSQPIIYKIAGMVGQVTQVRYRLFDDMDEGIAFLNYVDETLPDLAGISIPGEIVFTHEFDSTVQVFL